MAEDLLDAVPAEIRAALRTPGDERVRCPEEDGECDDNDPEDKPWRRHKACRSRPVCSVCSGDAENEQLGRHTGNDRGEQPEPPVIAG